MDNISDFDVYDYMRYWFMYEHTDSNEGEGEPISQLTGDDNQSRQYKN